MYLHMYVCEYTGMQVYVDRCPTSFYGKSQRAKTRVANLAADLCPYSDELRLPGEMGGSIRAGSQGHRLPAAPTLKLLGSPNLTKPQFLSPIIERIFCPSSCTAMKFITILGISKNFCQFQIVTDFLFYILANISLEVISNWILICIRVSFPGLSLIPFLPPHALSDMIGLKVLAVHKSQKDQPQRLSTLHGRRHSVVHKGEEKKHLIGWEDLQHS